MRKLEFDVDDDEGQLVFSCLAGDPDGMRAFVERFQGMVFGLCYRMLGHREDAEDVTQDVFLRAIRSLNRWDPTRPLKPWLFTIAANRCRSLLSVRSRKHFQADPTREVADPGASVPNNDLAEELQLAVEQVREEYRLCFVLHHLHELNLAEISEIVGCPIGTVKTWLFRVRRELAEILEQRGVVPQVNHELP